MIVIGIFVNCTSWHG